MVKSGTIASATTLQNKAWQNLAARGRAMVLGVGAVLALLLMYFFVLGPALRTWQQVPTQRERVAKDFAAVQALEQQAQQLKNLPSLSFDAAYQAVGSTTRNYLPASASVHVLGDQVTVKLQQVPAHSMAQWLAALRHNAKALPVSTQLSASAGESTGVLWSGEVVLRLPPRG